MLALATALLSACGTREGAVRRDGPATPPARQWGSERPTDPASANAVLMRAISLVGTPYRYGGDTPETGFDCSGLVNYVFRDMVDLRLPRTSQGLAGWQGPKVAPERLAAGDLVFFADGGRVFHVGIYMGDGRFVHAPSTGSAVRIDRLDSAYWSRHYSGARRVLDRRPA